MYSTSRPELPSGLHSAICPFVRNNLLQVGCRTTHPTHHQGVCKDRAGHSSKPHPALQQDPSPNSLCESILVDRTTKQAKTPNNNQRSSGRQIFTGRHFCECGRWSLSAHHPSSSCFTCSVSLPLLHSLLNCTTDGSSWFLKGFYFLISIFHVSFEFGTIPFSSEEETLC